MAIRHDTGVSGMEGMVAFLVIVWLGWKQS